MLLLLKLLRLLDLPLTKGLGRTAACLDVTAVAAAFVDVAAVALAAAPKVAVWLAICALAAVALPLAGTAWPNIFSLAASFAMVWRRRQWPESSHSAAVVATETPRSVVDGLGVKSDTEFCGS